MHRGTVLFRACLLLGLRRRAVRFLIASCGSLVLFSVVMLFTGPSRAEFSAAGALSLSARMTTVAALLFFTLGAWSVREGFSDRASRALLGELLNRGVRGRLEVSRTDDLAWVLSYGGLLIMGPLIYFPCLVGSGRVGLSTAGAATAASLLAAVVILPVVAGIVALLRWSSSPRLMMLVVLLLPELFRLVFPGSLCLTGLARELGAMVLRLGVGA